MDEGKHTKHPLNFQKNAKKHTINPLDELFEATRWAFNTYNVQD